MNLVRLESVDKIYALGANPNQVAALCGIDLAIARADFTAIWGPSGSGKSSLLNLIGLVDTPSHGSVTLDGERTDQLSDDALAAKRNRHIGFVFQNFNLIPVLDACENVMMPLQIRGMGLAEARSLAERRLADVGLSVHRAKRPDQMSGGQRQRVAIARALVGAPALVIADEPTANLDSDNSRAIIALMRELNRRDGVTFVFSTHDQRLLEQVDQRIRMEDGRIIETEA